MANDGNWPQTAAIEVCLPYNFAVVFDFTEIHKIKDDSQIKREKNLNRGSPRHIANV